jgi:hypothetical protein
VPLTDVNPLNEEAERVIAGAAALTVPLTVRFCVVAPPPTWVTVPLTDPVAADALNRTYTVTPDRLPLVGTNVLLPEKVLLSKLSSHPVGAVTTTFEVRFDPVTV